jgi:hypothetical protein
VAVGPGVAGVILAAALGTTSAYVAVAAIGAFLGVGLLMTFFFTGLALGLSAWTGRALYAGVATFGIALALQFGALAIYGVTQNPQVPYLDVFASAQSVAQYLFQTHDATVTEPAASAVLLALGGAILLVLAWLRLVRVEVVGE